MLIMLNLKLFQLRKTNAKKKNAPRLENGNLILHLHFSLTVVGFTLGSDSLKILSINLQVSGKGLFVNVKVKKYFVGTQRQKCHSRQLATLSLK